MSILLVGFDSAWTPGNCGAISGVILHADGRRVELGEPKAVTFEQATGEVEAWQEREGVDRTIVLLDQPTVVPNATGQRPVENIVSSPIGLRYGAVQPANTSRDEMFGMSAPVWKFLEAFRCKSDPLSENPQITVIETYPVLTMIALGWVLPDDLPARPRPKGRLPKYNPGRRHTFKSKDWTYVCEQVASLAREHGLPRTAVWAESAAVYERPTKALQDQLDACICLCVACMVAAKEKMLMIGQKSSGYIVVPDSEDLRSELVTRCKATNREERDWIHSFSC